MDDAQREQIDVADVLTRLDGLTEAPLSQHVAVLSDVHAALQNALAQLDEV